MAIDHAQESAPSLTLAMISIENIFRDSQECQKIVKLIKSSKFDQVSTAVQDKVNLANAEFADQLREVSGRSLIPSYEFVREYIWLERERHAVTLAAEQWFRYTTNTSQETESSCR